jgi:chorismate mutase/prephenate dehydrogenase
MNELDALRTTIREIDGEILRLVAARMDAVRQAGELKKRAGVALRDWEVERQVLEAAGNRAVDLDLPKSFARSIMKLLIAESRAEQERRNYCTYRGAAESIVVIGGAGKMGRWLVDFFANQGHRVCSYDIGKRDASATTLSNALEDASVATIATPLDVVPQVIQDLAERRYPGIVFDIASLKGHLEPAIHCARATGLRYTSVHPMFGPGTRTLSDQVICICECGDAEATERIRRFFRDTAATLVDLSLEEHDRIVAYVLGLSHLTNLVLTSTLQASGHSFRSLNRIGSTTFHSQMQTTATVIRDNPDLYFQIQRLNRFSPQVYEVFTRELGRLTECVQRDDQDGFVQAMTAGRRWVEGDDAD